MKNIKKLVALLSAVITYWPNVSLSKSLFYSLRHQGVILIGHRTSILMHTGGGVIYTKPDSYILIGIEGTTTVPCQLVIDGTVEFYGYVSLYKGVKIVVSNNGMLRIGAGTYINEYSRIFVHHSVIIGEGCAISWNVVIIDTDVHKIYSEGTFINPDRSIAIGNKVWIGFNSTISKGSIIGDNVIIGSNTFVHGSLEGNRIYYGSPSQNYSVFDKWV